MSLDGEKLLSIFVRRPKGKLKMLINLSLLVDNIKFEIVGKDEVLG